MRITAKFLPLLIGAIWLATGFSRTSAQEDAAPKPAPQAAPTPATSEPAPYSLDIPGVPSVPPSANTGTLFPDGARQNPPATTGSSSRNHRNALTTGTKQKGRSRDRTLQKADNDPLAIRVAYRRDKTAALARDPELVDLLRRANGSGTDAQKRACLREYYTRLFAMIRRIDSSPDMKVHLALLAQVAEQRYDPKRRVVAGEEELLNTRESAGRERLGR